MNSESDSPDGEILEAEAVKSSTPRTSRQAAQQLADSIGQVATLVCGGFIVAWSVFNLSWNFLEFRGDASGENNWLVAIGIVLTTCVLGLLTGFWLLFSSWNKKSIRQKK